MVKKKKNWTSIRQENQALSFSVFSFCLDKLAASLLFRHSPGQAQTIMVNSVQNSDWMLKMASHIGIQTRKLLGSNFFRGYEQNLKQVIRIYLEPEAGIVRNVTMYPTLVGYMVIHRKLTDFRNISWKVALELPSQSVKVVLVLLSQPQGPYCPQVLGACVRHQCFPFKPMVVSA